MANILERNWRQAKNRMAGGWSGKHSVTARGFSTWDDAGIELQPANDLAAYTSKSDPNISVVGRYERDRDEEETNPSETSERE